MIRLESMMDISMTVKLYIYIVLRRLKELEFKFNDIHAKVGEINTKLVDFDILEIMKHRGSNAGIHVDNDRNDEVGVSSHQIEELIMLIQNLEKKQNKKWEEVKKYDEEITKLKSDVFGLRTGLDNTNKDVANTNSNIETVLGKLEDITKTIQSNYDQSVANLREQIGLMKKYVDDKFNELKDLIDNNNLNNTPIDLNDKKGEMTDADMKLLKDLMKRVMELEKQFKLLTNSINVELIMKEITKFNEILPLKANIGDISELRERISNS
jgi:chromosome segregation ATPase